MSPDFAMWCVLNYFVFRKKMLISEKTNQQSCVPRRGKYWCFCECPIASQASWIKKEQILGKDLTGLGLQELQQLEQLLNEGLLSVKDKKEQLLMEQLDLSKRKDTVLNIPQ